MVSNTPVAIIPYDRFTPKVHPLAYVHPSAELLGEVEVGEEASIWPTTVLRGDNGAIVIGARTSIQDGSVCHATLGDTSTTVGMECTVGHRVVLHGCTVGDHCLVGTGSILLDHVELGEWSFVGAGALLTPGKKFPPRSFILGAPARRIREVSAKELESIARGVEVYRMLAAQYRGASP